MSEPPGKYVDRAILREAGKGLGVLGFLIVMMMWLAGAFVHKVASGPPASRPQPGKLNTVKVERRVYPLIIDQVGDASSSKRSAGFEPNYGSGQRNSRP